MTIQTSKFDLDTERRKVLNKLTLIGDIPTITSNIQITWSDDDYVTFNTARIVDMSSARAYLTNGGQFRRRAFKLNNQSTNPIRLEALELEVTESLH